MKINNKLFTSYSQDTNVNGTYTNCTISDSWINYNRKAYSVNIPRYESSSYFTQFLYENNYIRVMCNGNTGGGYLVIEYTKTTD